MTGLREVIAREYAEFEAAPNPPEQWRLDNGDDFAAGLLALPALRDVLAAAARDAETITALQRLVVDLTAGLNRELACTKRVRELHAADGTEPHACTECGEAWPCCTTQVLDAP